MIRNYFKITLRTLSKFKGYATINLLGLALGLASGILILIYVLDEISYDKFHTKADRIYRVGTDMTDIKSGQANGSIETNGWPIGMLLEKDFPEVEKQVYIANASNLQVNHEGKRFDERIFYAGKDFFEIFTFPMLKGNSSTALSRPNCIVITELLEKKYFNGQDALGKTLTLADTLVFEVTGVMKDIPQQSHMQFGMLISFATYESNSWFSYNDGWGNINVRNYILFKEGVDKANFFAKARNIYMDHVKAELDNWGMHMFLGFEPLQDIYLKTKRGNGMGPLGSIDRIYMVSGIAAFVILLACINFVNLATARSVYRAKEVGLRKVVGSTRQSLINQFLSESFLLTLFSFAIALALIGLLLPLFNQLLDKSYNLSQLTNPLSVAGMLLLVVSIALLSGYYPALVLSSMKPSEVLKGNMTTSSRGVQLRRVLVVFQFMISASLIISTLVVIDQLDYMQNRDLGFSGKQVLILDADRVTDRGGNGSETNATFKNEIKNLASVESVTFTNAVPGRPGWVGQWAFPADRPNEGSIGTEYMAIDEDYINTLGLKIIAGRNFELERPSDIDDGLIINEMCAQKMGWGTAEKAIGRKIDSPSKHPAGTVIGVVKDYHEFGLQKKIYPMAMDYNPSRARYYAIRFHTTGTANLLTNLEKLWKKNYSGYDLNYFFLDQNFAKQYQAEQKLAKVFTAFSVVTIIIAVIGLVGLVSFMITSKTKEIGVRKILGANVLSIAQLLSKEFLGLVLLANIIACPLAWYATHQWLDTFAYRTTVGIGVFVATLLVALLITIVAISFQTIKAALTNPVESLRNE
ncbi:MAG: ABC transporter permease [Bacteroidetes bacterium]|nr:ABC transporter permease [Bacteroidota bacterium]